MEQIEPIETTEGAMLPPAVPEPRWDPEKAAMRKVRVLKVPYDQDPMKEKTVFEFAGFVYICYAKKTRGRSMIRCLGIADIERPPKKEVTPFEAGKLLDEAEKDLDNDATGDAFEDAIDGDGIKEAIDKDIMKEIVKEAEGHGQSSGSDQTPDP